MPHPTPAPQTARNRLGGETSPYLLQHKDNPVHWWPWGPEALAEAARFDKPILLSVGYAACHWCHVMAHESFEDHDTAALMNDLFINIKVDREERPDVDALYMAALHALGEQGGWPLTMFLTPQGEPFWGGTYFPKTSKYGRPAFKDVLRQIANVYRDGHSKVRHNADALRDALTRSKGADVSGVKPLDEVAIAKMARNLPSIIDPVNGGMQGAPKFPNVPFLAFLWRAGLRYDIEPSRRAVDLTLTHIAQGGIYDHIGGGFARYAVDQRWLVPHFEKMLYDNALLVGLMVEVWKETRNPLYETRITETIDWLLRDMIAEGGGFAASFDADSEGEEGKFYVWSHDEIMAALGPEEGAFFADIYDITERGNWERTNIPNRLAHANVLDATDEARLAGLRAKLLTVRARRSPPGWDDKVLADWNGLAIVALARAADAFERSDWLSAAQRAYDFVKTAMFENGRCHHAYRAGQARAPATANDYANMIAAALSLHMTCGDPQFLADASAWAEVVERFYWSDEHGGYHLVALDTPDIILRTLSAQDDATPNANATMLTNLMALYLLTGEDGYERRAHELADAFRTDVLKNFVAHAGFLDGLMSLLTPQHVVIISPEGADAAMPLRDVLKRVSLPGAVTQILADARSLPLKSPARSKVAESDRAAAYVCIGPQCSLPVSEPDAFFGVLRTMRRGDFLV